MSTVAPPTRDGQSYSRSSRPSNGLLVVGRVLVVDDPLRAHGSRRRTSGRTAAGQRLSATADMIAVRENQIMGFNDNGSQWGIPLHHVVRWDIPVEDNPAPGE